MSLRLLACFTVGLCAAGIATTGSSQVSYNLIGGSYTQDFNTLAATGASNPWSNEATLDGWFASVGTYATAPATDNRTPRGLYSFGTGADRALGALNGSTNQGAGAPIAFGFGLTNDTGATLTAFTLALDVEKYQQSGGNDTTAAAFGLGLSSFTAATGWTSIGTLNLNNSVAGTRVSFTSQAPLAWHAGESLWFRWTDIDSSGQDRSLAIDNVAFSAIPEPSTYAVLVGLGSLGFAIWRRCRRHA